MLVRRRAGDSAARSADDEADLQQVRLDHVFERVALVAHRCRDRLDPRRAAVVVLDERLQVRPVEIVEPEPVDLQDVERHVHDRRRQRAVAADIGVIPHSPQQAIHDPRRAARARRQARQGGGVGLDLQQRGVALDDAAQLWFGVVLEVEQRAEPVAQRRRQHAGPCRRADQREAFQREIHRPAAYAALGRVVDAEVLERGVQEFLDDLREPVHLVDEEHVAGVELREHHHQVALAGDRRPAGDADGGAHLGGDDMGERGLADASRPDEQVGVARLAAFAGGVERDAELLADDLLADALVEPLRAEGGQEPLFVGAGLREDAFDRHA